MSVVRDISAGMSLIGKAPSAFFGICVVGALIETLLAMGGYLMLGPFVITVFGAYMLIVLATEVCLGVTKFRAIDWKPKAPQLLSTLLSGLLIFVIFMLTLLPFSLMFLLYVGPPLPAEPAQTAADMEVMFGTFLEQLLADPTNIAIMVAGTVAVLAFASSRFAMVPVISIAWQLDFAAARKRHAERFTGLRWRLFLVFVVLLGLSFLVTFGVGRVIGGPAGLLIGGLVDWIIGLALPIAVTAAILYETAMGQQQAGTEVEPTE